MSKIKRVESLVKSILELDPEARNDDFKLIAEVYYYINTETGKLPFNVVMLAHKDLKLPSLESITRARRKIQAEYDYLKASKEIVEIRENEEEEYRRYARR